MEEEYILNGKVYKASDLNSYAKKSGLSLSEYIKESGAKVSQASEKNYSLGGKNYDRKTLETYAKKSGLSFDEYIKEAGVKNIALKKKRVYRWYSSKSSFGFETCSATCKIFIGYRKTGTSSAFGFFKWR